VSNVADQRAAVAKAEAPQPCGAAMGVADRYGATILQVMSGRRHDHFRFISQRAVDPMTNGIR
jgi:hypothetical protein